MVELVERSAAAGLLPVTIGGLTLSEIVPGAIAAVMPFAGQDSALAADLGFDLPAPNRTAAHGDMLAIWAGQGLFLVLGGAPASPHAAAADHTDAWAVFDLAGPGGAAVLARLCPVDLREAAFEPGHTARSLLGHMNASLTRLDGQTLRVMVYRSMAQTAVHELTRAMEHAQRGA